MLPGQLRTADKKGCFVQKEDEKRKKRLKEH